MEIQRHSRFQHHPLDTQFVQLRVEGDIAERPLDVAAAHGLKPLHEFPRNPADHLCPVVGKYAQRRDIAHRGHAAEETVLLHQGDTGAFARGGDGRDKTGRPAAAYDHVVIPHDGNILLPFNLFHGLPIVAPEAWNRDSERRE